MARIIVRDHPELTKERALELFRNHFSGKYEVQEKKWGIQRFCCEEKRLERSWSQVQGGPEREHIQLFGVHAIVALSDAPGPWCVRGFSRCPCCIRDYVLGSKATPEGIGGRDIAIHSEWQFRLTR